MRAEDEPILRKKRGCRLVCRQSVMIERRDPLFAHLCRALKKLRNTTLRMNRLGLFWNDKESRLSLIVKRRFECTNSRPIIIEEVFKSWMKRSSHKKKNFVVLIKETNDVDKIISFIMNSYWSKIGIFVKLMRKVSMKWKNWIDFKVQHSTRLLGENWSKSKMLSMNSLERFRNCRMKSNVWVILQIFKMLNQYAVDIHTLPVDLCLSHFIQFLVECVAVLWECGAAEKGRQSFGTQHGIPGNVANPAASSSAPYPQELNLWSSHISEPLHSSTAEKNECQTPVQDQRCQSWPSAKNAVILVREILHCIMGQTNDCRSQISTLISSIHLLHLLLVR